MRERAQFARARSRWHWQQSARRPSPGARPLPPSVTVRIVTFTTDDIEQLGFMPNSTAMEYSVSRNGQPIGRVHVPAFVGLKNSGQDPDEWLARQLTELENDEGYEALATALRNTLVLR